MGKLGPHSENNVIHGNCLDIMQEMPDGCIDLVCTDPPYGIGYKTNRGPRSGHRRCARGIEGDSIAEVLPAVEAIARILKEGSALYWFTRFDVYPVWHEEISKYLNVKTPLVWDKRNHTMGDLKGDYGNRVELIIYAVRGRHILRGGRDHNLLSYTRPADCGLYRLHPHQKPVELIEFLIAKSSDEGNLVLDPFVGSGTTVIAADRLNRKFLGVDIDYNYVELAINRLRADRQKRSQLELGI